MLNNLTIPPIYNYMGNNSKNLTESRNHGLSLTNLTHCISPSEYYNDYYGNNSFNEINLQLHASSVVSNPYSFSIKSNTKFSANVQSALPTTETKLLYFYTGETKTLTIPKGVNVIKIVIGVTNPGNGRIWIRVKSGDIIWISGSGSDDGTLSYTRTAYIGVSAEKNYTIVAEIEHEIIDDHYINGEVSIYYSAEINTHTPDVEDY